MVVSLKKCAQPIVLQKKSQLPLVSLQDDTRNLNWCYIEEVEYSFVELFIQ